MKTYQPGQVPSDPKELPAFLRREFEAIRAAANRAEPYAQFQILHVEPARVFAGMLVYADGTDFDPSALGTGEGLYRRNEANNAWVFIG